GITRAGGILGMNVFAGSRLAIDFGAGTAAVGPSGPTPAGFAALAAQLVRGDLVVIPILVDGVPAHAMIDTGARRTLGNPALQAPLGLAPGSPRLAPAEPTTGASRDSVPAWSARLDSIAAGGVRFARPTVTFTDAPVFARTFPAGGPALVLGV